MHLHPPRSFRPTTPLAVGTHTMKKRNKKSFNWSLAQWNHDQTTGEFLGRTAKSWGLILLFSPVFYGSWFTLSIRRMWAMLQTLKEDGSKIS